LEEEFHTRKEEIIEIYIMEKERKKETHKHYRVSWDEERRFITTRFLEDPTDDDCRELKEEARALGFRLREGGEESIRIFLDIRSVSESYSLSDRNRALLVEGLEYVDRMAIITAGKHGVKESLDLLAIVKILFTRKDIKFFKDEDEAKQWLLKE